MWNPRSVGATLVAALAIVVLAVTRFASPKGARTDSGQTRRQRNVVRRGDMTPATNLRAELSPDASAVVYRDTVGGPTRLWIKQRASEKDATPVAGTDGAASAAFSPDGKWISFSVGDKLKKVPTAGGSPVTLADSMNTQYPYSAWIDDTTIAFVGAAFSLMTVSASGGTTRTITRPTDKGFERGVIGVTAIPGSRAALISGCTSGCIFHSVWSVDIATGATKLIAADAIKAWHLASGHVAYVRKDGGVFAGPL